MNGHILQFFHSKTELLYPPVTWHLSSLIEFHSKYMGNVYESQKRNDVKSFKKEHLTRLSSDTIP